MAKLDALGREATSDLSQPVKEVELQTIVRNDSEFTTIPALEPIPARVDVFKNQGVLNRYDTYRLMRQVDPMLNGAIQQIATMVGESYDNIWMRPSEPGGNLTDDEKVILKEAREFAGSEQMNFPQLFVSIADKIIQNGDFVALKRFKFGETRLPLKSRYWRPLPLAALTAVEREEDIGQSSAQVWEANFYVLNETMENVQHWPRSEIIHIPLNNYGTEVFDNEGRYTFGIWSNSLLKPLETTIKYKWNTIQNDIKWRHISIPRLHTKVDLSAFQPDRYPGPSEAEKIQQAGTAANTFLKEFRKNFDNPDSEQGLMTDLNTIVDYVEPKATTYATPNGVLDQENRNISAATGIPGSLIGGDEGAFSSMFIASSFAVMHAENVARSICNELTVLVREHILRIFMFRFKDEDLLSNMVERLECRLKDILLRDRVEKAKLAGMKATSGVVTVNEVREELGLPPISPAAVKVMNEEWASIAASNPKASLPMPTFPSAAETAEDIARKSGRPTVAPSEKRSSDTRDTK